LAVRMTRQAISPRLAMSILVNIQSCFRRSAKPLIAVK
jgi:hypothetical protein